MVVGTEVSKIHSSGSSPWGACSSHTRMTHTVTGSLLARGSLRGGKSVSCPKASWSWIERAWRPCLAGTSNGRLAWLGRSHQKMRLRRATGLEEREHIGAPISNMHPYACLWSGNAHKGFLSQAPQHLAGLRAHGQHRLHEKAPSAFVADLSHAADLASVRQIDVGRILHQQHDGRGQGLFSALLQVRLHQRRKGDVWLIEQPIQRFSLFPGVHVSGQRTQGVLRQLTSRLDRASRATQIMQLDTLKGSLGPALGIQHVLCEVGGQRGTIYSLDLPGVANRGLPVVSPDGPFPTAPSANRAGYFHSTRLSRPSVHLPRPDVPSGTARVLYPLSSPAPLPPVLSITSSVWVLWVLRDLAARAV